MADDLKISELAQASPLQSADQIAVERNAAENLRANMTQVRDLINPPHIGDVTGQTDLTAQPDIITTKPAATPDAADLLLISDTSAIGALKRVTISDLGLAVNPTLEHDQLVGLLDDDHTQYVLANGTRAITGNQQIAALTVTGISSLATTNTTGGALNGSIGQTTPAAGSFTTLSSSALASLDSLSVTGLSTLPTVNIDGGTIDGTGINSSAIGQTTPAAGSFTALLATGLATLGTVDINGGNIDGTTIGAAVRAPGNFTTLLATGLATLASVDINGGNIDGTTIGAAVRAAGNFTTLSTIGLATLATADINGGNIDGTTIGASVASTGGFQSVTTITLNATNADINGGTLDGVIIGGANKAAANFTAFSQAGACTFTQGAVINTIVPVSNRVTVTNETHAVNVSGNIDEIAIGAAEHALTLLAGFGFNFTIRHNQGAAGFNILCPNAADVPVATLEMVELRKVSNQWFLKAAPAP